MVSNKYYYLIAPSLTRSSPVKGAIALANGLCQYKNVVIFFLKKGNNDSVLDLLDKKVDVVFLSDIPSWIKKVRLLRKTISKHPKSKSIIISSCFSADMVNTLCTDISSTCSSIRGNLLGVYPKTYGFMGSVLAYIHYFRLRKLDYVVSMTYQMSVDVQRFTLKNSPVIGNFVDESRLEYFRRKCSLKGSYRFVFVGSLTELKQPVVFLNAIKELHDQNMNIVCDIYGDGPLKGKLIELCNYLNINNSVNFHGHINEPFSGISNSDVMVLPSLTEGVSRSILEAMFLGIPCVLRDVDGNSELISDNINGVLFNKNKELPSAMIRAAKLSRINKTYKESLLKDIYRQRCAVNKYINLFEGSQ